MLRSKLLKLWQKKGHVDVPEDGIERRKFVRIVYPYAIRPFIKVQERELEILSISEEGMKILNTRGLNFREKVSGTVKLISGRTLTVYGKIVWEHKEELGLLISSIPVSILHSELRTLLKIPAGA